MKYTPWTKEQIQQFLVTQKGVERALLAIYDRQTADEQRSQEARYHNKVGFSAAHSSRGCYYAKWILSGKHLSGPHIQKGREIALHYVGQLTDIANENRQMDWDSWEKDQQNQEFEGVGY